MVSRSVDALHWVWTSDEIRQPASVEKIIFTIILYGALLFVFVFAGVGLRYANYETLAFGLLISGVAITAFLGTAHLAWDVLNYFTERQVGESATASAGEPSRELSPGIQLSDDTLFGFLATFLGLIAFVASLRLTIELLSIVGWN